VVAATDERHRGQAEGENKRDRISTLHVGLLERNLGALKNPSDRPLASLLEIDAAHVVPFPPPENPFSRNDDGRESGHPHGRKMRRGRRRA